MPARNRWKRVRLPEQLPAHPRAIQPVSVPVKLSVQEQAPPQKRQILVLAQLRHSSRSNSQAEKGLAEGSRLDEVLEWKLEQVGEPLAATALQPYRMGQRPGASTALHR